MLENTFAHTMQTLLANSCVVGLSGGLDSVVLLHLLVDYRDRHANDIKIIAAHVNHNLRGKDSDGDEAFCEELCKQLDVTLRSKKLSDNALGDSGIEEQARNYRHAYFSELCQEFKTDTVILAHHADDQAETILMRIMRGAGLRGMCGMRQLTTFKNFCIFRPLLDFSKDELKNYAQDNSLEWREDASNSENIYFRNRVRNELLPLLENISEGTSLRLCENAKAMQPTYDRVLSEAQKLADTCLTNECDGILLDPDNISQDDDVLVELLRIICEDKLGGGDLSSANFSALLELVREKNSGTLIELPHNIIARRECDGIFFIRDYINDTSPPVVLPAEMFDQKKLLDNPHEFICEDFGVKVTGQLCSGKIPDEDMKNPNVEWLNPSALDGEVILRRREDGDRFSPLGNNGSKKIKDMLIDSRVPTRHKENALLLCDQTGILWLWPLRLDSRAAICPNSTSAIRLTICKI